MLAGRTSKEDYENLSKYIVPDPDMTHIHLSCSSSCDFRPDDIIIRNFNNVADSITYFMDNVEDFLEGGEPRAGLILFDSCVRNIYKNNFSKIQSVLNKMESKTKKCKEELNKWRTKKNTAPVRTPGIIITLICSLIFWILPFPMEFFMRCHLILQILFTIAVWFVITVSAAEFPHYIKVVLLAAGGIIAWVVISNFLPFIPSPGDSAGQLLFNYIRLLWTMGFLVSVSLVKKDKEEIIETKTKLEESSQAYNKSYMMYYYMLVVTLGAMGCSVTLKGDFPANEQHVSDEGMMSLMLIYRMYFKSVKVHIDKERFDSNEKIKDNSDIGFFFWSKYDNKQFLSCVRRHCTELLYLRDAYNNNLPSLYKNHFEGYSEYLIKEMNK